MFGSNIYISKLMILIGVVLIVLGILNYYFGNIFSWFGSLPGDINVKKENFSFYFPFTSMILLSLLLNVIYKIYVRFNL